MNSSEGGRRGEEAKEQAFGYNRGDLRGRVKSVVDVFVEAFLK